MDNILDLRDIKRPQQQVNIPVPIVSKVEQVDPPIPSVNLAERGQLTREQVNATRLTYFFQRENGEIFSTSAMDAYNQIEYMRNTRMRNLKFIGTSDGSVRRKMMQEKGKLMDALNRKIQSLGFASIALNNKEAELLVKIGAETELKENSEQMEKIVSEQNRLIKMQSDIEKEVFDAEIEDARTRGGKIPNFTVAGNESGVAMLKDSTIFKNG